MTLLSTSSAGDSFRCSFTRDGWKAADWILAKSSRSTHFGGWIQHDDHIENMTPECDPREMLGKRAAETYTSMVTGKKFSGDLTIRATMSFDDRMAPLVVLAPELGKSAEGIPEYREHWEVVLFDHGVNIWHHVFVDGKQSWKKDCFSTFPLKPKTRYLLEIRVARKGKGALISVKVDGHELGYFEDVLPPALQIGVTGCEGVNRFYDFSVEEK